MVLTLAPLVVDISSMVITLASLLVDISPNTISLPFQCLPPIFFLAPHFQYRYYPEVSAFFDRFPLNTVYLSLRASVLHSQATFDMAEMISRACLLSRFCEALTHLY